MARHRNTVSLGLLGDWEEIGRHHFARGLSQWRYCRHQIYVRLMTLTTILSEMSHRCMMPSCYLFDTC